LFFSNYCSCQAARSIRQKTWSKYSSRNCQCPGVPKKLLCGQYIAIYCVQLLIVHFCSATIIDLFFSNYCSCQAARSIRQKTWSKYSSRNCQCLDLQTPGNAHADRNASKTSKMDTKIFWITFIRLTLIGKTL
jgi:uncharacterized protein YifE (UPF0438 family)